MRLPVEQRMFFIVGRGRSGTSLLARLLDAHPEMAVAPESLFVLYLRERYLDADWSDPASVQRFAADLWHEERMRRWQLDPVRLGEHLLEVEEPSFARLCAEVYRLSARARDSGEVRLLGDKNPHYTLFIDELAELFPAARFVYVVRAPWANVASYRNVRFDASSVATLAERWRLYNERALAAAEARPERFLTVRFECLVRRPAEELGAICRFLGVDYDDRMLTPPADGAEDLPAWHRNLRRPPDPSILDAWRVRLSDREAARVEAICGPLARRLGIPPPEGLDATPSPAALGVWKARRLTSLERFLFRLPLELRSVLIRGYRAQTGNRIS